MLCSFGGPSGWEVLWPKPIAAHKKKGRILSAWDACNKVEIGVPFQECMSHKPNPLSPSNLVVATPTTETGWCPAQHKASGRTLSNLMQLESCGDPTCTSLTHYYPFTTFIFIGLLLGSKNKKNWSSRRSCQRRSYATISSLHQMGTHLI